MRNLLPARSFFNGYFDLNGILQAGNFLVVVCTLVFYAFAGGNEYIDTYTVAIFTCFGMQNALLLLWEKKAPEPLLLILLMTVIPFYMLRVPTLIYEPWSTVLVRFPFSSDHMNHALLFIMFAVLSLAVGVKAGKGRRTTKAAAEPIGRSAGLRLFGILALLTCLDFLAVFGITVPFQGFLSVFFYTDVVLILLFVAYALEKKESPVLPRSWYLVLFIAFVVVRTLGGSRSALLTTALSVCFVSFSMYRTVRIRRYVAVVLMGLLPIAFIGFSVTTFYRPYRQAKLLGVIDVTPQEFVDLYLKNVTSGSFNDNMKIVLCPMFDRAGYLDMAADMIINRERYAAVVNPIYYFKSVVDNVFTPGIDLFDTPRAANNTVSIYNNLPLLKRDEVDTFYQSDMFTLFGESYVFFGGYPALLACFLVGFLSKLLFEAIGVSSGMWHHALRAVFLKLYNLSLWSFGFDWQVGDILFIFISLGCLYLVLNLRLPRWVRARAAGERDAAVTPLPEVP